MNKLFLVIFAALVCSCNDRQQRVDNESDEQQILNLALDKVVSSEKAFVYQREIPPTPIPLIGFTDRIDSAKYLEMVYWRDSAQKVLDTASLFITVSKVNAYIVEYHIENLRSKIVLEKSDTDFNVVLDRLFDQNLSKDTTDIRQFKSRPDFVILEASKAPNDELRRIGKVEFSKIAFSDLKDKACIYTHFSCGHFCGIGSIYFFKKENNKWSHVKTWQLWET